METAEQLQEKQHVFGTLAIIEDSALAEWFGDQEILIHSFLSKAQTIEIKHSDDKEIVKNMIVEVREYGKEALAKIKPFKDRVNEVRQQILDREKDFSVPADQAQKILKDKLNARLDLEEKERIAEENRLRELAEKDRIKRLDAINAKLEKLTGSVAGLADKKAILEASITDETSVEEAEVIRARIEAIDAKLAREQGKVIEQQTRVQETAIPTFVNVKTEKVQGVASSKKLKCTGVSNEMALLRAIVEGKIPAWKGLISFNLTQITKLANMGQELPGCEFAMERDTRIRR